MKLFSSARDISRGNRDQRGGCSRQIDQSQSQKKKDIYIQTRRVQYLLVVQHAERFGRHAVDAPLGVPVLVAYRDGEPAIVCPYQVDQFSLAAFDLQRLALASVCGVVPLCNRKRDAFFSHFRLYTTRSNLHATARTPPQCTAATRGESNVAIICARSNRRT